jgi:hypothetical protein
VRAPNNYNKNMSEKISEGSPKIGLEVSSTNEVEIQKDLISETHPAITAKAGGQSDINELRNKLKAESYNETNITAAMFMRLKWLESQEDSEEELRQSKLTLRIIAIYEYKKYLQGIVQGIKAALEHPEYFDKVVNK